MAESRTAIRLAGGWDGHAGMALFRCYLKPHIHIRGYMGAEQ